MGMPRHAGQDGIYIKDSDDPESSLLKFHIIGQGLSQISGADDNHVIGFIQSQDLADLRIEIFHIITVSLLSEPAEII